MRLPGWIAAVGVLECSLGAWGVYMAAVIAHSGSSIRRTMTAVALVVLALASIWAGARLARRDPRGVGPSIALLLLQSVRVIVPGLAWAVALGWSLALVLYAADGVDHGLEVIMYVGRHDQPSYLAINLLAAIPAIGLALWQRAASVAPQGAPRQDAAA